MTATKFLARLEWMETTAGVAITRPLAETEAAPGAMSAEVRAPSCRQQVFPAAASRDATGLWMATAPVLAACHDGAMTRRVHALVASLLTASLLAGCSLLDNGADDAGQPDWDASVSMTPAGVELADRAGLAQAPTYLIEAEVDPESGQVTGTASAGLPVGTGDEVLFRFFPGLPDFDADASLGDVTVDGEPVEARRDSALVRVPLPEGHDERVSIEVPFGYTLPMTESGGGLLDALGSLGGMAGPADIGLLSRHEDAWNLGHWFPLWIPEGGSAEPVPAGFGDIGNSPAALIRLRLSVPETWDVIDGGIRTDDDVSDGRRTISSEGYGMNDLVVSLVRGYVTEELALGGDLAGVVVRAHGPEDSEEELAGVLEETATSLEVLSEEFVAYPWREFDVVAAPLGSGVAGMEWPGATWIEPALFGGGVPGLGGLEDMLGGLGGLGDLQGLEGLEGLGDLGGFEELLGGLGGGDTGRVLQTLRPWTIAHEVGHEWWHILVGNDSVLSPVADEPLAQYSACLVMRELAQGSAREIDDLCRGHIEAGYEQMRLLGGRDAAADQATDAFDSSLQYSGVVYGKAAAFYLALEEEYGRDEVVAALGAVTEEHAFTMITADGLREALAAELGEGFDAAWARWIEGTHGDADLGVEAGSGNGGLPDLEGLEGLEGLEDLEGLLGGDTADLEELLGSLLDDYGNGA